MKNSKLFLSFMTLSLFLTFTACSNDDEKEEVNSIVGRWTFSESTADVIETNKPEYKLIIGEFVAEVGRKDNNNSFFVFTENDMIKTTTLKIRRLQERESIQEILEETGNTPKSASGENLDTL